MRCTPNPSKQPARRTLKALVNEFLKDHKPRIDTELTEFRDMPSLDLAIHHVARATSGDGKRHSHQYRIKRTAIIAAEPALLGIRASMRKCKTFADLHSLIEATINDVFGIGELYIYDAALRLGAYLGFSPEGVYLHAGTREGAVAIGFDGNRKLIPLEEFPLPLQSLTPDDIESFLCIYKKELCRDA